MGATVIFVLMCMLHSAHTHITSGNRVIFDNLIVRSNGKVYRGFKGEPPAIFTLSKCTYYKSNNNELLSGMTVLLKDQFNRTCSFINDKTLKCSNEQGECNVRILNKHGLDHVPLDFKTIIKFRMTNVTYDCGADKSTIPISCSRRLKQPWYSFQIMNTQ